MTVVGIILIIIGSVFMIGSFFVSEKLSGAEIDEMSKLSQVEINRMLEKELEIAQNKINQTIDDEVDKAVDRTMEEVERKIDKETNDKIMAIDDFSNTVIENMNKTHSEIMFLYGMLNDKQSSISETVAEVQNLIEQSKVNEEMAQKAMEEIKETIAAAKESEKNNMVSFQSHETELPSTSQIDDTFEQIIKMEEQNKEQDVFSEDKNLIKEEETNHNLQILSMHKEGKSNVEIAKKLNLGMGEVKLVLDLFREEEE